MNLIKHMDCTSGITAEILIFQSNFNMFSDK